MALSVDSLPAMLTPKQFAEITGLNMRSVIHACAEGRLPAKKIPGSKLWRIKGSIVKEWLEFYSPSSASQNADEGASNGQ